MTVSSATAIWQGGLKSGSGNFQGASGVFQGTYSFPTRFEGAKGTNPEELLAAAHSACLSMALSAGLEQAGTPAKSVTTTASVTMSFVNGAPRITNIKLVVRGKVPGVDQAAFLKAAEAAKGGCPVSNLFKGNTNIELDALLLE
ncbi:MAG TPA: OsmC family peroxiredoxin [Gemmatimonadales bacterium]|nr:OsmC family peroxiredoxin [Gemmatimonadales bacterium]